MPTDRGTKNTHPYHFATTRSCHTECFNEDSNNCSVCLLWDGVNADSPTPVTKVASTSTHTRPLQLSHAHAGPRVSRRVRKIGRSRRLRVAWPAALECPENASLPHEFQRSLVRGCFPQAALQRNSVRFCVTRSLAQCGSCEHWSLACACEKSV